MEKHFILFFSVLVISIQESSSFVTGKNVTISNGTEPNSTETTSAPTSATTLSNATTAPTTTMATTATVATTATATSGNASLVNSTTAARPAPGNLTTAVPSQNQTEDDNLDLMFQDLETEAVTENILDDVLDQDDDVVDQDDVVVDQDDDVLDQDDDVLDQDDDEPGQDYEIETNDTDSGHILVEDDEKLSAFKSLMSKDKIGKPLTKKDKQKARKNRIFESGPVNVTAMFNPDLFEGDIVGAKVEHRRESKNKNAAASIFQKWPDGIVPYQISAAFAPKERAVIFEAMEVFHKSSCVQWVPREPKNKEHEHFVHIVQGPGCASTIGRQMNGGQILSLGKGCMKVGIIVHEMLHTVGFLHEQSRIDRDDHIKVVAKNIQPQKSNDFVKYSSNMATTLNLPYDVGSILHYPPNAFSANGKDTIVPLKSPDKKRMGQRIKMSKLDLKKLNKYYECKGKIGAASEKEIKRKKKKNNKADSKRTKKYKKKS